MVLGGEPPGRVGRRRDFSIAPVCAMSFIAAAGAFSRSHAPYDRTAMADDRRRASTSRQGRPPAKRSGGTSSGAGRSSGRAGSGGSGGSGGTKRTGSGGTKRTGSGSTKRAGSGAPKRTGTGGAKRTGSGGT